MFQSPTENGIPTFEIIRPGDSSGPVVLNAPHSGSSYSASFLASSRLSKQAIRASEDVHVDELFGEAAATSAPLMRANFPRAWLDVNREPYELDPAMFAGALPPDANMRSARVAGGLGTVPRIVAENQEIYSRRLPAAEALNRIDTVYKPYHRALRQLIEDAHGVFGLAVLVDCHSMPSAIGGNANRHRPDIVLGDRYGTSCGGHLTDLCASVLGRLGYRVTRNRPYAGGYITEHYGHPGTGRHALQVEINRSLYMNERTLERNSGFSRVQRDLSVLVDQLAQALDDGLFLPAQAAE